MAELVDAVRERCRGDEEQDHEPDEALETIAPGRATCRDAEVGVAGFGPLDRAVGRRPRLKSIEADGGRTLSAGADRREVHPAADEQRRRDHDQVGHLHDDGSLPPSVPPESIPTRTIGRCAGSVRAWPFVALAAVLFLATAIYLPYYSIGPGPARPVAPLIRFDGHPRYESEGSFVLTSIHYEQLTALGMVQSWLDPDRSVVSRDFLFRPGETVEQEQRRATSQMDQSKLDAAYVVLDQLTGYPRSYGQGVLIESVVQGCAADGELFPGDLVRAIDGDEVDDVEEASLAIRSAPVGARISFDVTVDGERQAVSLVREPCGGQERAIVGVCVDDRELPVRRADLERRDRGAVRRARMGARALRSAHARRSRERADDRGHGGARHRRHGLSHRRARREGRGRIRRRGDHPRSCPRTT